jgi:hypothetical protein
MRKPIRFKATTLWEGVDLIEFVFTAYEKFAFA